MTLLPPSSGALPSRTRGVATRAIACALLVAAAAACGGPGSQSWAAESKAAESALKVATVSIEPRAIERHYGTSGTLRALRSANLVATQPALVEAILVEEGDRVKDGQVLARLDGRDVALQAAQAGLQLQNLQRELERLESVPGSAISKEEIDKQRYLVEEARAALKLSKHQVGLTSVRAPFAGTITARLVDVGVLAGTATQLFSIADLSVLDLDLHLPERDAATVKPGAEVELSLVDGTVFAATVVRRAPVVDAATGTVKFTVRATQFPSNAAPGAFTRAKVLVDARPQAPSLPRSAVFEVEGKSHVYVIEDGKAHRRAVVLGLVGTDVVEIVDGVLARDVVVAEGGSGITEGMPVEAGPAPTAAPAKGS